MSSHILELGKRIFAAGKAARAALLDKTVLIISEADRRRTFPELDDRSLALFTRAHLAQCARATEKLAAEKKIPVTTALSMHGSLSLYRICDEADAVLMTIEHAGVTWKGKEQGDWRIIISRERAPS